MTTGIGMVHKICALVTVVVGRNVSHVEIDERAEIFVHRIKSCTHQCSSHQRTIRGIVLAW
jgi:hypothetical protein